MSKPSSCQSVSINSKPVSQSFTFFKHDYIYTSQNKTKKKKHAKMWEELLKGAVSFCICWWDATLKGKENKNQSRKLMLQYYNQKKV